LKEHFSQFGEVTKVLVNVERNTAAVEFATHQQAATARNLGIKIHSHDVILTWRKFSTRSNSQGQCPESCDYNGQSSLTLVYFPRKFRG